MIVFADKDNQKKVSERPGFFSNRRTLWRAKMFGNQVKVACNRAWSAGKGDITH